MWNQLLKTKEKVKWLLEQYPALQDSDNKLIATFWSFEAAEIEGYQDMKARDFLKLIYTNKLTNTESIRRCRAKLQELHEELRGTLYNQKQNEGNLITQKIKQL